MTDTFQKLVGRAPISAGEFVRRHAAVFTPSSQAMTGAGRQDDANSRP
jgi:hypothetical protein